MKCKECKRLKNKNRKFGECKKFSKTGYDGVSSNPVFSISALHAARSILSARIDPVDNLPDYIEITKNRF